MSVKTTTGYIAEKNFTRISTDHYQYASAAPERAGKIYDIFHIDHHWTCYCPDANSKRKAGMGERCKHERGLIRIINERITQNEANRQAQEIAEREAERGELAALRAELAEVRAAIQSQTPATTPDLSAILSELAELKAENVAIKKALATKATARKKHMRETEIAMAKELINDTLDDVVEQAQNAIQTAERARQQIADLEAIPYELKTELDRLTEEGKEELQPEYEAPEPAPEIKAAVREAQEADRKSRQAERERREKAPLNGNQGYSLLKK